MMNRALATALFGFCSQQLRLAASNLDVGYDFGGGGEGGCT